MRPPRRWQPWAAARPRTCRRTCRSRVCRCTAAPSPLVMLRVGRDRRLARGSVGQGTAAVPPGVGSVMGGTVGLGVAAGLAVGAAVAVGVGGPQQSFGGVGDGVAGVPTCSLRWRRRPPGRRPKGAAVSLATSLSDACWASCCAIANGHANDGRDICLQALVGRRVELDTPVVGRGQRLAERVLAVRSRI